jgi:Regulator of ribonuclease activity B/Family of unknown function (DUF695)
MTERSEEWEYYNSPVSDREPVVTTINLSFQDHADIRRQHPWLILCIAGQVGMDRVGGLAHVQQLLKESVGKSASTQLVARKDRPYASEFWFYSDRNYEPSKEMYSALGGSVNIFVEVRHDPDWSAYFGHLLPQTESQILQTMNGKVMRELKRSGDNAERPHVVVYRMDFQNREDFAKCESIVKQHGLSTLETASSDIPTYNIMARFSQELPQLSLKSVNEATINLVNLAARFKGKYDGWQTRIEK